MKKFCISKGWELQAPGYSGSVDLPNDYSITLPRSKDVPGAADNGFFPNGVGVYSKELMFSDISRHYILDIDGAYMCTTVALNGCDLVMHPHGYTPMLVDLTANAVFGGKNRLVITTDAKQPSTRWYSGAGIYRDVYLWDGGDIRIEPWDKFVYTPSLDTVKAEYKISADRTADIVLYTEIRDRDTVIRSKECLVHVTAEQKTKVELTFDAEGLRVWDTESPFLYTMRAEIRENGSTIDIDDTRFGIRTLSVDAENGLLLNGKSIKLRGGCIHHDHGVLGAADYPAACRRKLMRLRDTGFNALRIAHNPPSLTLLELCDEMGIIVMDEAFDCWRQIKGGEWNYHRWFDTWWERDISYMVLRDRNHPCVFSYSIGNEIPESYGTADGDELSARLTAEIKKYDITRPITSATWQMGEAETWADRTEKYFAPLDMCGYNYIYRRYESDHERYPARVIWGSETHAIYFYDSWNSVLRNNHVIGDFTWTAYDNLGEAGTGRALWARDGRIDGISLADYPWRSCYQGDLDLCGYRRPQSYFREAVWIGGKEPRIFTTHPEHYGEEYTGTTWHWYDVLDTWTFNDSYIGKPVPCEVYTDADEIVWYCNGRKLGSSIPEKAVARFDIPYEKGEIAVDAYKNGVLCGHSSLHTVGTPAAVKVKAETESLCADNRDLCYFDITVTDAAGDRIPDAASELRCTVEGGTLMGIFSGDPCNEDQYGSDTCHAFAGRALAIVRTDAPGEVCVTVSSLGLEAGSARVTAIQGISDPQTAHQT